MNVSCSTDSAAVLSSQEKRRKNYPQNTAENSLLSQNKLVKLKSHDDKQEAKNALWDS